jgi:DNA-binding MarR family transcriptional regulator
LHHVQFEQAEAHMPSHSGPAHYSTPGLGLQSNNTYTYDLKLETRMSKSEGKPEEEKPKYQPPNPRESVGLPIDSPERRRLPLLLRRAWYGLNQAFRRRIAHLGITPDQFTVMRTLLENEGISQRRLTELMSSDANTVASLVERMEKAGLVERQAHEKDRRAHWLRLKPRGKRKYEAAREIAVAMQAEVLSALPAGAREKFLEELDVVAQACRVAAEKSPKAR